MQRRGAGTGLLGQVVLVIARLGALGGTAAAPLVGAAIADAGIAGPLLAEEFLGAAGHLAAARSVECVPASLVGQVHQHDVVAGSCLLIVPPNASAGSTSTVPDRIKSPLAVVRRSRSEHVHCSSRFRGSLPASQADFATRVNVNGNNLPAVPYSARGKQR